MRKRNAKEIVEYFRDSLSKGDIVVHKIKPHGYKKHIIAYSARVGDKPL